MFSFPLTKRSQQRKTARHCKTPMKSNIVSIGSYVWLFLLDFVQTEIACWSSVLVNFARKISRELCSVKNVSTLALRHLVSWGWCDITLLLCKTCLHAVSAYGTEQGFSKYGSRPQMGSRNVILGSRNQLAGQIRNKNFCIVYKKIETRPAVNLFLLHFYFRVISHLMLSVVYHDACLNYQMIIKTRHNKLCVVTLWLF